MLLNSLLPITIFLVLLILICLIFKNKNRTEHFDEMQLKTRGDAYKVTLFVVLLLNAAAGLLYAPIDFNLSDYIDYPMASFCILFIGITVFAVYAIMKDAFFSVNDNGKTYIIVCVIVILSNLAGLIPTIISGEFMPSGSLEFSQGGGNLLNLICFVIILAAILIKKAMINKEDAE